MSSEQQMFADITERNTDLLSVVHVLMQNELKLKNIIKNNHVSSTDAESIKTILNALHLYNEKY